MLLMMIVSFVSGQTIQERMKELEENIKGWRELVINSDIDVNILKTNLSKGFVVNPISFFVNNKVGESLLDLVSKQTTPDAVDTQKQQAKPTINPKIVEILKNSDIIKRALEKDEAQKKNLDLKFLFTKQGTQEKELKDVKEELANLMVKDVLSQDTISSNTSKENKDLLSTKKIGEILSKAETNKGDEKKISSLLETLKIDELINKPTQAEEEEEQKKTEEFLSSDMGKLLSNFVKKGLDLNEESDPLKLTSINNSLKGLNNRLTKIGLKEAYVHDYPNLGVIMLKVHEVEIDRLKNDSDKESSYDSNLYVLEYLILSLFVEKRLIKVSLLKQRFFEMLKVHLFVFEKPESSQPQQPSEHFLSFIKKLNTLKKTFKVPVTITEDMQNFTSSLANELMKYTKKNLDNLDKELTSVRQSFHENDQEKEISFNFVDLMKDFGTQNRLLI